jgi:hypothetical protein
MSKSKLDRLVGAMAGKIQLTEEELQEAEALLGALGFRSEGVGVSWVRRVNRRIDIYFPAKSVKTSAQVFAPEGTAFWVQPFSFEIWAEPIGTLVTDERVGKPLVTYVMTVAIVGTELDLPIDAKMVGTCGDRQRGGIVTVYIHRA